MPNRDQTGPRGEGPQTGRGMGPCGTTEKQLNNQRGQGAGRGRGGAGRGRGGAGRGRGGAGRGRGGAGKGRRRGPNGITYFT